MVWLLVLSSLGRYKFKIFNSFSSSKHFSHGLADWQNNYFIELYMAKFNKILEISKYYLSFILV